MANLRPAAAPPRPIFNVVLAIRNWLLRLADRLVPAQVAMIDRIGGYYLVAAIHAAARLGLADQLVDGPRTPAELASRLGVDEELLGRLVRALASFGVFEATPDGRYRQNRLSATLVEGAPDSMRALSLFAGAPYHLRAWDGFVDVLRTGQGGFTRTHGVPLFDYLAKHPEDGASFAGAMVSLTAMDAPAMAAAYDFSALGRGAKVCDVAGGRGTLLAHILARHPHLRGVLFDEAVVVDSAGPLLASYGVKDRVEVVSGSFFEKIPEACAAYVLKDILHDWNDEKALQILKTVRAAMAPGARLLVIEMVVDGARERYFGNLLDLEMLVVMDGGRQRSKEQMRGLFEAAGLRLARVIPAASPTSIVEAIAT